MVNIEFRIWDLIKDKKILRVNKHHFYILNYFLFSLNSSEVWSRYQFWFILLIILIVYYLLKTFWLKAISLAFFLSYVFIFMNQFIIDFILLLFKSINWETLIIIFSHSVIVLIKHQAKIFSNLLSLDLLSKMILIFLL